MENFYNILTTRSITILKYDIKIVLEDKNVKTEKEKVYTPILKLTYLHGTHGNLKELFLIDCERENNTIKRVYFTKKVY